MTIDEYELIILIKHVSTGDLVAGIVEFANMDSGAKTVPLCDFVSAIIADREDPATPE